VDVLNGPIQDIGTLGILILGVLTYLGNRGINKGNKKLDAGNDKLDTQNKTLEHVKSLVNSQLTDAVERKDVAEARTKVLEDEAQQTNKDPA
jgi:hypothetical protein